MSSDSGPGTVLPADAVVRAERPGDRGAIASVVETAFGSPTEARLVKDIRASAGYRPELALVAERAGEVVGHVMISGALLRHGGEDRSIAMLSPLAVAPHAQSAGIGSMLVLEVGRRADRAGEPLVVLEGSPVFYGRLGFEHSEPLGIRLPLPAWAPSEAGQVLRLRGYDATMRGDVVYPPPFQHLH